MMIQITDYSMDDPQKVFAQLEQEEKDLELPYFSREDALKVGLAIVEKAKEWGAVAGVEITINGLSVFRYLPEGITKDHEMWLARKRHAVEFREMSSLRLQALAKVNHQTMEDWKIDPNEYAWWAGGYPIKIKGTGTIGAIAVTNIPGEGDHTVITTVLSEYFGL
jgi:uncharacterized protein (UPF0303 family)